MSWWTAFSGWDTIVSTAVIASFIQWLATRRRRAPLSTRLPEPSPGAFAALRLYERKVLLIGVGFVTVLFLGLFGIVRLCDALDVPTAWRIALGSMGLIGGPLAMVRLRYPGTMRWSHGLAIHAPPALVWDTVRYRPTDDYYRATVARITARPGAREAYDLHIREFGTCPRCGLPYPPDRSTKKVTVEILQRVEGQLERTRSTSAGEPYRPVVLEEQNEWRIEPHPDGAFVTRASVCWGPQLWVWETACSRTRNPARDNLIALKAHLEGGRGVGSFSAAREMLDAARAASAHCHCG